MKISTFSRFFIIGTIALLLIGYLFRLSSIYFFWEAKTLGWVAFFLTLILLAAENVKYRRVGMQKTWPPKIIIGLSVLALVVKAIFFFAVPHTASYAQAIESIKQDQSILKETGPIKSVFLQLQGSISSSQTEGQQSSEVADFFFTVKGERKFRDVRVSLSRMAGSDWIVIIH